MALVSRHDWRDDDWLWPSNTWRDRFAHDWADWPMDWPRPRDLIQRFRRDSDRWWRDWPSDWPRMDAIVPRFSSHLDRFDRNWRDDPFWRDLYPRWAEPIFKEGIDVKTNIVNDRNRFAVDIDTYQFKPEELQVKTLDDTLLIEGRHEDVRDADNYTKMHFVRKYQLPSDVMPQDIVSSIDSHGRLMVEARKRVPAIDGRERSIPIESAAFPPPLSTAIRPGSSSSNYSRENQNLHHDAGYQSQQRQSHHLAPPSSRGDSRASNLESSNFLAPTANNGYRNEFSSRSTDANGMRHESRREEFREEIRRSGSHSSLGPTIAPQPILNDYGSQHHHRNGGTAAYRTHSSSSRNDFRVETPGGGGGSVINGNGNGVGGEHTLRPTDELGDRSHSRAESARSVRIQKTYS